MHFQQRQNGSLKALKHNCARIDKLLQTPLSTPAAHFTALAELAPAVDQSLLHTISHLVTFVAPTQYREQTPDQIS